MPLYDFRCEKCDNTWEAVVPAGQVKDYPPECPECGSNFTKLVWLSTPSVDKAKDPYDLIDGAFNDGKKIYAGKYARSK